jgi:hypothetical protein
MASKTRVPNKVQWALDDILTHCQGSRKDWQQLVNLAEKRLDPEMAIYLAKLRDHISEIQHLAARALEGEYKE